MSRFRWTRVLVAMLVALTLGLATADVASAQPGEGCCHCLQCPQGDFCSLVGDSGRTCTEVCAGCGAIGPNDLCSPECFPVGAPAASRTGLVLATDLLVAVGEAGLQRRLAQGGAEGGARGARRGGSLALPGPRRQPRRRISRR